MLKDFCFQHKKLMQQQVIYNFKRIFFKLSVEAQKDLRQQLLQQNSILTNIPKYLNMNIAELTFCCNNPLNLLKGT